MVLETDLSCNCAFVGFWTVCGILIISTAKNADIILDERVCRVLTKGPRAFTTAIAKIGSLSKN